LDPSHKFEKDSDIYLPMPIPSLSGRNYHFFGVLAGVRYFVRNPIAPNRGIPGDACKTIKEYYNNSIYGFHSSTWLKPSELKKALKIIQNEQNKEQGYSYTPIRDIFDFPADVAFNYDSDFWMDINGSVLNYIRIHNEWDKVQNMILGTKSKTQYRFILWFDS